MTHKVKLRIWKYRINAIFFDVRSRDFDQYQTDTDLSIGSSQPSSPSVTWNTFARPFHCSWWMHPNIRSVFGHALLRSSPSRCTFSTGLSQTLTVIWGRAVCVCVCVVFCFSLILKSAAGAATSHEPGKSWKSRIISKRALKKKRQKLCSQFTSWHNFPKKAIQSKSYHLVMHCNL